MPAHASTSARWSADGRPPATRPARIEVIALIHRAIQKSVHHFSRLRRILAVSGERVAGDVPDRVAMVCSNHMDAPAHADDLRPGIGGGLGLNPSEDEPLEQAI